MLQDEFVRLTPGCGVTVPADGTRSREFRLHCRFDQLRTLAEVLDTRAAAVRAGYGVDRSGSAGGIPDCAYQLRTLAEVLDTRAAAVRARFEMALGVPAIVADQRVARPV